MRPVPQGAAWVADARAAGRARVDRRPGRSRGAARTARLIGAIVAGGGNTRFGGEPKGLLTVGGRRIIDRVAAALVEVTDDLLLVSNSADAADWLPGVRVVRDRRSERGSLIGLHSALDAANDDVLVVAWDMPFVDRAVLELIRARFSAPVFAAVPETARGIEPFCAAYSRECLWHVESAIESGDLRAAALIDRLPVVRRIGDAELHEAGDPTRMFFNVNTADDLAAAERMARGG